MIELIPAIDVIDGKCVRLSQGDYQSKKVYNENPVEVAKMFEAHGIHRLHVRAESEPGVVLSQSASVPTPQWIATKAGAFGNAPSLHRAILAIHAKQLTPTEES